MTQKKAESPRGEKSGNKKAHRSHKVLKVFLFLLLIAIAAGIGIVTAIIIQTKPVDADNLAINLSSSIYYEDKNGDKVILQNLYDSQNRVWADLKNIPLNMQNAFVAIEDERFYSHPGFDTKRTASAAFNSLIRLVDKNRSVYGGSTITQQLIKNLSGDDEQTFRRKVQEIYRAYMLEQKLTKNQILELYLNSIYLSQQCNGVAAASRTYFGKDLKDLSLAECASIAGITQYPSKYDPFINSEANKEKQEVVLGKMLDLEMITPEEYKEAMAEKLNFKHSESSNSTAYSYFVDTIIEEVLDDLVNKLGYSDESAEKALFSGGLQIKCTIDKNIQSSLDKVYQNDKSFPSSYGKDKLQSAMVIIESSTGEIKGIVGGRGKKENSRTFNRATALRQPGSTIKPIGVYAPALEYNVITAATSLEDTLTKFTLPNGQTWTPKNSGGRFSGKVTVQKAISNSLNIPAVKVLDKLGTDVSYSFLNYKLGVSSLVGRRVLKDGQIVSDKALAALSLGGLTDGISPIELGAAYIPFSNKGIYIEPHTYTEIYNSTGDLVYKKDPDIHQAMKSSTATIMTTLLEGVVKSGGTGAAANFNTVELAGKTGTTTNDCDRWFVGYTPSYVGVTWVGYDTPKALKVSGNPAIPLWKSVMSEIDNTDKPTSFSQTLSFKDIHYVTVCTKSGKLATDHCKRAGTLITVPFASGTVPTSYCTPQDHTFHKTVSSDDKAVDTVTDNADTATDGAAAENSNQGENSNNRSSDSKPLIEKILTGLQ
ncbi:MAG: PBP1A family penicillin-binding protein [Bacillota bacterium]|nr:PBP1A family penicillin-binding protein [Bacillota bacterium]